MTKSKKVKICYVVCYRDPNYTRTNSLINAIKTIDNTELLIIKNKHKGFLRYLEVPPKLLMARLRFKPDVFVVGFRAHEIFWAFYPSMMGKKIIFDEFIDHHDWIINEHNKFGKASKAVVAILDAYMKAVMNLSEYVLTDTEAHAKLCAENYKISPEKVRAIPAGADEQIFYPQAKPKAKNDKFNVVFYGSMLPLHGAETVLSALKILSGRGVMDKIAITFVGGGDRKFSKSVEEFGKTNGLKDHIKHIAWVKYHKLPEFINEFHLGLGGPFGGTGQARRVVTGKTYQLLAMAKPTIVGKIENMHKFKDKENCLIVEQGSDVALANALEWAVTNEKKLKKIGQNGRKLYEREFSAEVIGKKLETLMG